MGRFGYSFHVAIGVTYCFCMGGPTASVEIATLLLMGCWLVRLPFVWRGVWSVVAQPANIALVAWVLWMIVSIAWSSDPSRGWYELTFARWMGAGVFLWPVMDKRRWLISALVAGLLLGHAAQLAEWIAWQSGVDLFSHPLTLAPRSRVAGWWYQPAMAGVMCVASMGMHAGPLWFGRGRARWLGALGVGVSGAALLATGTRGAWLAGGAIMLVCVGVRTAMLVRHSRGRGRRPRMVAACAGVCVVLVACAASWLGATRVPMVRDRVEAASHELSCAVHEGAYDSDMGGRVLAGKSALAQGREHPIIGEGLGSFQVGLDRYIAERGVRVPPARREALKQAHSTPLHTLAGTGLVGLALLVSVLGLGLLAMVKRAKEDGAWVGSPHAPGAWTACASWLGTYRAAPLGAMAALCFAGLFETLHVNMNSAALVTVLLALSPWCAVEER